MLREDPWVGSPLTAQTPSERGWGFPVTVRPRPGRRRWGPVHVPGHTGL